MTTVLQRIRWAAIGALAFIVLAIGATAVEEDALGIVLALASVTFAILSLNES